MAARRLNFSSKLFISVLLLFLIFASCFIMFQYKREKTYKQDMLNIRLQSINLRLNEFLEDKEPTDSIIEKFLDILESETFNLINEKPRITIINTNGDVLFDSSHKKITQNHLNRPEIKDAIKKGNGYTISRLSETTSERYFYSATYFKDKGIIIRSSMPYDINLINVLKVDSRYLWATIIMTLILIFIFYRYTHKIGKTISQLHNFAKKAERNENIENISLDFPHNELGDISNHIVELYAKIKKSEEDKIRLKRQLTQNISHELKTPVSSIQGYLETIVSNPDMAEDTKTQFLNRCYNQANRLTSLLNDISTLNRMDEADNQYDISEINLLKLLETIDGECALQLKEKNMTIYNLISPKINLEGNYSLLYSIFRNLTDNAIAYAGYGTSITIKCIAATNERYTFSFADNGVGVDEKHLPHLFERFYRVDKGRSRKLGGTGLGLAIVKNAVMLHNGTISVRRSETGGLEFIFSLPRSNDPDNTL